MILQANYGKNIITLNLFLQSIRLSTILPWQKSKETTPTLIECFEHLGEIYLISGKSNKALSIYSQILPVIKDKIRKARIYMNMSQACFKKRDITHCEYYAKIGLSLLGERLILDKNRMYIHIPIEIIKHFIHMLFPFFFIREKNRRMQKNTS